MQTTTASERPRYHLSLRIIHWCRAATILGMIALGWWMVSLDDVDAVKFDWGYPYHKSFGILAFLLALTQLTLRGRFGTPAPSPRMGQLETKAAHIAHVALYVLMIAVPLLGYARSSTFPESDGIYFFGLDLPELLGKNNALSDIFSQIHAVAAYSLLGLIALHVAGAIKHRLFDKDPQDSLSRML